MVGRIEGAACSLSDMGRRGAEWLLSIHGAASTKLVIAYDYEMDIYFLIQILELVEKWATVDAVIEHRNIGASRPARRQTGQLKQCGRSSRNASWGVIMRSLMQWRYAPLIKPPCKVSRRKRVCSSSPPCSLNRLPARFGLWPRFAAQQIMPSQQNLARGGSDVA